MSSLAQSLANSLANSLSGSISGGRTQSLMFSWGEFTNTSTRHMMIKNPSTGLWEMAGPFSSGVLASRVIGGKRYGQFCSTESTINTYSEVFNDITSDWNLSAANITDNATASPLRTITADMLYDDSTPATTHSVYQPVSFDGASSYLISCFCKAGTRSFLQIRVSTGGFGVAPHCDYDLATGVTANPVGVTAYGIVNVGNGWYYCYFTATSTAAAVGWFRVYLQSTLGSSTYDGDGSSGLYIWGANACVSNMLRPYIYVTTPAASTLKDQFYWSEATIAAKAPWVRNGFRGSIIMDHATDEMLAADGGEHLIAAYNTTGAKGVVELYFDGADKKIKWRDDDTGALGESAAINNSLGDKVDLIWTLDNGANSTLAVDGAGLSTTYNGIQTAAADGALYYGMNNAEALQLDVGHLSEPESLT